MHNSIADEENIIIKSRSRKNRKKMVDERNIERNICVV